MWMRAVFVWGVRPCIESACNASGHDPIVPDRCVVGNFSDFALTPTIPGLCSCQRRRESPPDARIGSRLARLADVMTPGIRPN